MTDEPNPPDTDLLREISLGNRNTFAEWVERYGDFAYALARRSCRNSADAEDVVQDAWMRILRSASTYRGEGSVRGWIARIVLHTARNRERTMRRSERRERRAARPEAIPPDRSAEETEAREQLEAAVRELPSEQREPVLLHYYHGMSQAEAAASLERPIGTIKWQLHEAVERLRIRLGRTGLAVPAAAVIAAMGRAEVHAMPAALKGSILALPVAGATASAGATLFSGTLTIGGIVMQTRMAANLLFLSVLAFLGGMGTDRLIAASQDTVPITPAIPPDAGEAGGTQPRPSPGTGTAGTGADAETDRLAAEVEALQAELDRLRTVAQGIDLAEQIPADRPLTENDLRVLLGRVITELAPLESEDAKDRYMASHLSEFGRVLSSIPRHGTKFFGIVRDEILTRDDPAEQREAARWLLFAGASRMTNPSEVVDMTFVGLMRDFEPHLPGFDEGAQEEILNVFLSTVDPRHPETGRMILRYATHRDLSPHIRGYVVDRMGLLAEYEDPEVREEGLRFLESSIRYDPHREIRVFAVQALAKFPPESARPLLEIASRTDPDEELRRLALNRFCGTVLRSDPDAVRKLLRDVLAREDSESVRERAEYHLGALE